MVDMRLKIVVQLKLDEHCIFGLGRQQSEKTMLATRPMWGRILLYSDCGEIILKLTSSYYNVMFTINFWMNLTQIHLFE